MLTILKISGAVVLGLLLATVILAVTARWWLSRLGSRLGRSLAAMAAAAGLLPPRRATLRAVGAASWNDQARLDTESGALERLGFRPAGDFVIEEMPGVRMRGLVHPDESVLAAVCEHDGASAFWIDIVQIHADDSCVTVTSAPPTGMAPPPWKTHVRTDEADGDAGRLWALFQEHRRPDPVRRVAVDDFAATFEEGYAREMDELYDRGGPTESEIQDIARLGGGEADPAMCGLVRRVWNESRTEQLDLELREQFLATTSMSAAEWERVSDRLVIVHDRLDEDVLDELISDALDWDDEDACEAICEDAQDRRGDAEGREAFRLMLDALPERRRHEKIGEVHEPVAADLYVESGTTAGCRSCAA